MALTKELIDQAIQGIKNRPRPYMIAQPFQNYAPVRFTDKQTVDPSQFTAQLLGATQNEQVEHNAFMLGKQNEAAKAGVQTLRGQVQGLRGQLRTGRRTMTPAPPPLGSPGGGRPNIPSGGMPRDTEKGKWGAIPEVSDLGRIRANAPQTTFNWHGSNVTVNSQVAPIFRAFLNNLWKTGYHPQSVQGYNYRNIAGTNTRSLHSYGLAIDIDPTKNPYQDATGHMQTALPHGISALASKYGLAWGGDWQHSKDPMHFSVPWGGRE